VLRTAFHLLDHAVCANGWQTDGFVAISQTVMPSEAHRRADALVRLPCRLRLAPTDRCCCSTLAGSQGVCQTCCGPPIHYAARSVIIVDLISSFLNTGDAIFPLFESGCCVKDLLIVRLVSLALSVSGAVLYCGALATIRGEWSTWMEPQRGLATATATRKLSTLVVAHSFYQFVYEVWHFVQMGGFLMSPRAASPELDRQCRSRCETALREGFTDDVCRQNNGRSPTPNIVGVPTSSNPQANGDVCAMVIESSPSALLSLILNLALQGYFGYILWSLYMSTETGGEYGDVNHPPRESAREAYSVPVAIPTQDHYNVAQSAPIAVPIEVPSEVLRPGAGAGAGARAGAGGAVRGTAALVRGNTYRQTNTLTGRLVDSSSFEAADRPPPTAPSAEGGVQREWFGGSASEVSIERLQGGGGEGGGGWGGGVDEVQATPTAPPSAGAPSAPEFPVDLEVSRTDVRTAM
jgi:hypothetical protein